MKKFFYPIATLFFFIILSCREEAFPKPKAQLRLEYPQALYELEAKDLPLTFEKNKLAKAVYQSGVNNLQKGMNLEYPLLNATVYLSYMPVTNNIDSLLRDAQNLTQKHVVKADDIKSDLYENEVRNVYGMFYQVLGNAASQSQFYATDSTNHFLTGSLYFYAKPNFDSIQPAAAYIQNDMVRLMETIVWKKP